MRLFYLPMFLESSISLSYWENKNVKWIRLLTGRIVTDNFLYFFSKTLNFEPSIKSFIDRFRAFAAWFIDLFDLHEHIT